MARERFAVADSDMHVIEPADLWINYIEPQFKARAPVGLTEVPRDVAIEWEGKRIPNRTPLSRQMLRVTQTAQADRYEHAERRGYDAVSRLGVPICFHEGGSGDMPYIEQTGKRFDRGIMGHVVSHSLEMMQACVSMCMGGVLERFPRLRVAFLEGNCAWAPWLLWRMDEHVEWRGAVEAPDLARKPSEYFRRQCWVSVEC